MPTRLTETFRRLNPRDPYEIWVTPAGGWEDEIGWRYRPAEISADELAVIEAAFNQWRRADDKRDWHIGKTQGRFHLMIYGGAFFWEDTLEGVAVHIQSFFQRERGTN